MCIADMWDFHVCFPVTSPRDTATHRFCKLSFNRTGMRGVTMRVAWISIFNLYTALRLWVKFRPNYR